MFVEVATHSCSLTQHDQLDWNWKVSNTWDVGDCLSKIRHHPPPPAVKDPLRINDIADIPRTTEGSRRAPWRFDVEGQS
eukprot:scaffold6708_cov134-Cylindrotheca_fusiformis.AAC.18